MKDIKTLYRSAKRSATPSDIRAYTEAVQDMLQKDPVGFITNAEYIISSSIGCSAFPKFVEQYGLCIPAEEDVRSILESCIEKGTESGKDISAYKELQQFLETYECRYQNAFSMFRHTVPDDFNRQKYIRTYYGTNASGIQNRRLAIGMIGAFGEAALPDALITAESMGNSAINVMCEYTLSHLGSKSPLFYEYLHEAVGDLDATGIDMKLVFGIRDRCASHVMESVEEKRFHVFRESALMGEEPDYTYTEAECAAIQDLVAYKEYKLTECTDPAKAVALQKEIYQLYENYGGVLGHDDPVSEDVADSVIPMQPRSMSEANWMINTRNKKDGSMPLYISRNHDLSYGEEDPTKKDKPEGDKPKTDDDMHDDPSLDDFRRPSAQEPKEEPAKDTSDDEDDDDAAPQKGPSGTTNYYYYTYTNSLNQNRNSFNKDSSHHDDHSVTNKRDDHSVGKRIRSDNVNSPDDSGSPAGESAENFSDFENPPEDDEESHRESVIITENAKQDWEKECRVFQKLFNYDLNKLGDIRSPAKSITLTIDGRKMKFITSTGYSLSTGRRVERYASIPTSVHLYNVHRDQFEEDRIGIAKAVKHYITLQVTDANQSDSPATMMKKYHVTAGRFVFKPCGEVGLTFSMEIDGKKHRFGLNIRTDLSVIDGDEEVAYESVEFDEGFVDTLKAGVKKVAAKVKGVFFKKKTLANLQQMDIIRPLGSEGGVIPIPLPSLQNGVKQESGEIVPIEEGVGRKIRSFLNICTESDIMKIVSKLQAKYQCDVIFAEKGHSPALDSVIGPAALLETDVATIERLRKNDPTLKDSDFTSPRSNPGGNFSKVIVINPALIVQMGARDKQTVQDILEHEYGHYRTFNQISDSEWMEYHIKRAMIDSIAQKLAVNKGSRMGAVEVTAEANYAYYALKPERLANEAAGIDPKKLTKRLFGVEPKGNVIGADFQQIIAWKVPTSILNLYLQVARGNKPGIPEQLDYLKITAGVYDRCITNLVVKASVIDEINRDIKALGGEPVPVPEVPNIVTNVHKESADTTPGTFQLFGVEFTLPDEIGWHKHQDEPSDEMKQKAHQKMIQMLADAKKLKAIEDNILDEERQIGNEKDSDDNLIKRIQTYLGQAVIDKYGATSKGNALFRINIPYIKGVTCAWLDHELWITSEGKTASYDAIEFYEYYEAADGKPESDHPIRDRLMDLDRTLTKTGQATKKKVQEVQQVATAATKPVKRTAEWVKKMVYDWKDADENNIKERLADPHARKNIFSAISWSIKTGALLKAGLLFNPIFLFLTVTKNAGKNNRVQRIRNEMLAEIKTEIEIINEKIQDCDRGVNRDPAAKYKLMRFRNELKKKYLRVADTTHFGKMI